MDPFDSWKIGGCRYHCFVCDGVFVSSVQFRFHVQRRHGMDPETYKKVQTCHVTLSYLIRIILQL